MFSTEPWEGLGTLHPCAKFLNGGAIADAWDGWRRSKRCGEGALSCFAVIFEPHQVDALSGKS